VFHLSKYPLYPNQPSFHLVRYLGKHCQCESCSHCGFTFDWRPVPIAIPGNRSLDIVRLSKECWLFLLKAFAHRIGSPMTSARVLCFFFSPTVKAIHKPVGRFIKTNMHAKPHVLYNAVERWARIPSWYQSTKNIFRY